MTMITDTLSATATTTAANAASNNLDQTAFLRLMTAQLKMQDPFKPLDSNDMVAQMAQFSTVAGIAEMNVSLKELADSNQIGDVSSWLGRNVLLPGDRAVPNAAGQYAGEFTLDAPSTGLSIDFLNDSGEIVQAIELGPQEAGTIAYDWDAFDGDGKPLDLGMLRIRVNGGVVSGLSSWTRVDAVQSPTDPVNARLLTERGAFAVSDALRLS
ncbi:MAG: flagellar hook capping FlgD N-terminal domain-containing protein [Parasphingorhabdus sp.]|uniref:flagellar hook assembly protein FlgD n=1 Tax=Parasphingorhabdus sp. TaxID=2709688 RepID=UPI0030012172